MQNTKDLCLSVYSRGEGSCFPSHDTVHYATHQWKHRQFVSIDEFQRRRELFPFPWHYSVHNTPMICACRCIPEVKRTIPLPPDTIHSQQHRGKYRLNHRWKHRQIVVVDVFQRRRELSPFSCRWWQLKCIE
jgi:hypothetical protein